MSSYKPQGVCAQRIDVELDNDTIKYVKLHGGCRGQSAAIANLVNGTNVVDTIKRLRGTPCRVSKDGVSVTSCADQLSRALELEYRKVLNERESKEKEITT